MKTKTRRSGRDLDLLEKLKHENKKLKRENSTLRKQIERADIRRLEHLEALVDTQRQEDKQKAEKKKRECFECGRGHLQLQIFNRRDGVFYYRSCSFCEYRTRFKKYHDGVEP